MSGPHIVDVVDSMARHILIAEVRRLHAELVEAKAAIAERDEMIRTIQAMLHRTYT